MAQHDLAQTKACSKCGNVAPLSYFAPHSRPGKRHSHCRDCAKETTRLHREKELAAMLALRPWRRWPGITKEEYCRAFEHRRNIKARFGLSLEEYFDRVERQGHRCAICRAPVQDKNLAIDHCHETGVVRGLLCQLCNRGLGLFQDNPALVADALRYLWSWQTGKREKAA